ncbi:MAG: protein kinase [Verrucomicrobiota bacterium]
MSNESLPVCPQCGAVLKASAPAGLCPNCLMALNLKTETVFTDETPAAQPPLPPEQLAPHFPQLEILEFLGRGGMGVVYKARQKTLNRLVALKLLAPERVGDAKFAERFTREAQALAALNHPNIVTIHDFGSAGGFYYLLMEFVDGLNLRQLLRARKFTPEEALAIVPPLCDALQFAHDRGIIHRDIKPENLLLDKAGRVKVADFGIARMIEPESDRADLPVSPEIEAAQQHGPTSVMGTPGYSAPEQKTDPQRVDSRADIYSLGVVFYEMLTGELPGKCIELPSRKVQIDVRLDEVVLRALEKQPALRYQQVSEVKTCVETIAASPPSKDAQNEKQNEKEDKHQSLLTSAATSAWPRIIRRAVFVGLPVWLITIAVATIVTFMRPVSYVSETKVLLRRFVPAALNGSLAPTAYTNDSEIQLAAALIPSELVLGKVVEKLDLNHEWGRRYSRGETLKTSITLELLRRRIDVRTTSNSPVIGIWCSSENPAEAVELAKATVESYVEFRAEQVRHHLESSKARSHTDLIEDEEPRLYHRVTVIQTASPPLRRPSRTQNIFLGVVAGMFLGGIVALVAGFAAWRKQHPRTLSATTQHHGRLAFGFFLAGTLGTLLLMTISPRHELALIFGGMALVLALIFGMLGWRERLGKGVVIATVTLLAGLGMAVAILAGVWVLPGPRRQAEAKRQELHERAQALTAQEIESQRGQLSFGPVVEQSIAEPFAPDYLWFDLDAGLSVALSNYFTPGFDPEFKPSNPSEHLPHQEAFRRLKVDSGVDLSARLEGIPPGPGKPPALVGLEMAVVPTDANQWDSLTPSELKMALATQPLKRQAVLEFDAHQTATYLFRTREGGEGILQVTGFADNPREVKIRYKLVRAGAASSGSRKPEDSQRKFVRLVVDKAAMTFEGQPTRWDGVGTLLDAVADRPRTVLEFAVTSDQITVQQQNEWFGKCAALAKSHGFEYASFIGIQPLGSKGSFDSPAKSAPPISQAGPGEFKLTLSNGVSAEVVAVTANPLANQHWWQPNGTPLPQSPGERVIFHPAGMASDKNLGENEHALLVRCNFPPGAQSARQQTRYTPKPEYLGTLEIQQGSSVAQAAESVSRTLRMITGGAGGSKSAGQVVGLADVVRFPPGTAEVTVQFATAAGPWEALASFDGRRTTVRVQGVQVLCTQLRQEANGKCLDVTHDVNRDQYALRMVAVFKDGEREEVALHSGVQSARETQGYVRLEPGQRVENIQEFVLERTPWVRGEIRNIALRPKLEKAAAATSFDPVGKSSTYLPADAPTFGTLQQFPVVPGKADNLDSTYLDLDTGRSTTMRLPIIGGSSWLRNWLEQEGMDVRVTTDPDSAEPFKLTYYNMTVTPMTSNAWPDGRGSGGHQLAGSALPESRATAAYGRTGDPFLFPQAGSDRLLFLPDPGRWRGHSANRRVHRQPARREDSLQAGASRTRNK